MPPDQMLMLLSAGLPLLVLLFVTTLDRSVDRIVAGRMVSSVLAMAAVSTMGLIFLQTRQSAPEMEAVTLISWIELPVNPPIRWALRLRSNWHAAWSVLMSQLIGLVTVMAAGRPLTPGNPQQGGFPTGEVALLSAIGMTCVAGVAYSVDMLQWLVFWLMIAAFVEWAIQREGRLGPFAERSERTTSKRRPNPVVFAAQRLSDLGLLVAALLAWSNLSSFELRTVFDNRALLELAKTRPQAIEGIAIGLCVAVVGKLGLIPFGAWIDRTDRTQLRWALSAGCLLPASIPVLYHLQELLPLAAQSATFLTAAALATMGVGSLVLLSEQQEERGFPWLCSVWIAGFVVAVSTGVSFLFEVTFLRFIPLGLALAALQLCQVPSNGSGRRGRLNPTAQAAAVTALLVLTSGLLTLAPAASILSPLESPIAMAAGIPTPVSSIGWTFVAMLFLACWATGTWTARLLAGSSSGSPRMVGILPLGLSLLAVFTDILFGSVSAVLPSEVGATSVNVLQHLVIGPAVAVWSSAAIGLLWALLLAWLQPAEQGLPMRSSAAFRQLGQRRFYLAEIAAATIGLLVVIPAWIVTRGQRGGTDCTGRFLGIEWLFWAKHALSALQDGIVLTYLLSSVFAVTAILWALLIGRGLF